MDIKGYFQSLGLVSGKVNNAEQNRNEFEEKYDSLIRSQAVIEFDLQGNILFANDNFLNAMGYQKEEIVGQHHSIFLTQEYKVSEEYKEFWQRLRMGEFFSDEFKRIGKNNKEVWIQATYNPVLDSDGRPYKVLKLATEITERKLEFADLVGQNQAISRSQAVIEFDLNGMILVANDNFLNAIGYELNEIVGKHHSMFVEASHRSSSEYMSFWKNLSRGEYFSGEFRRIGKHNKEIWIQASYNPIFDMNGKPFKIVKYATDITQRKTDHSNFQGQVEAISRSQAVIEFDMNGIIQYANDNFLNAMGYILEEIEGKHHSVFVESSYAVSAEYKQFWAQLQSGKFFSDEYRRLGKNGKEVWIQASYNPIMDANGKPFKVVKYASDITEQKLENANFSGQIDAINRAQAVIEFDLSGTILFANDNFLSAMGYTSAEVVGKHHSIFVESSYKSSSEYEGFWLELKKGSFVASEFKRIGKGGNEIWIQASYNPIFDMNGRPFKVVKYATDITERKLAVNELSKSLIALSEGDLSNKITLELTGEFNTLKVAMNETLDRLSALVGNISNSSNTVRSTSVEIQGATSDLNQRTEEQAASLEETASSMEELNSIVSNMAENAKVATSESTMATERAEKGGEIVKSAVYAMSEIETSSKSIADIIGVIDEIAFQTNLLALNAAVEAARAGEQGRGFAVVAGEVRNLAQRSAQAAKEIKELINNSVNKVAEGTRLVNESGKTLSEIVESVRKVSQMILEISTSSQEQASGIGQINKAVAEMDGAVQQNAAMVEQALAATTTMADESSNLLKMVGFFSNK